MKRILYVVLALFVVVSMLFAACTQATEEPSVEEPVVEEPAEEEPAEEEPAAEEPAEEEPVELVWLGWSLNNLPDPEGTYYEPFQETHPNVSISIENYPWGEHGTKTMTLAQNGELHDVLQVANVRAAPLDDLGALEDLTPYIEAEDQEWKDFIYDAGYIERDGRIIGLAWAATPYSFVYNKDMFAEKGLEPPTNFEEFKEVLQAFRDEEAGTYGATLTFNKAEPNIVTWLYVALYLAQKGGSMLDENGMPAFNNDLGVEAVDYFIDLIEEDLIIPGPQAMDHSTNREMFCSGQLPVTIDGSFMKGICAGRNPDINLGFVHMEDVTGGHTTGGAFWAIAKDSEHKEESWEYVKFLTSPYAAKEYFLFSGQAPMFDVYSDPDVQEDEFARVAGEILFNPDTQVMPILPEQPELQRIFAEQIQLVLLEGKDTKQALDDAAAGWREILEANQ
jgi:ABC-type glycerol-3-phosphate transport system substrate-binding protein